MVLSENIFNQRSGTVIGMALTSQQPRAGFPLTLHLADRSLPKPSWAKISQIRTLACERVGTLLGHASDEELSHLIEGLNEILGH